MDLLQLRKTQEAGVGRASEPSTAAERTSFSPPDAGFLVLSMIEGEKCHRRVTSETAEIPPTQRGFTLGP